MTDIALSATHALSSGEAWRQERARWEQLIKSGALPSHISTPEKAIAITRMGEMYGWDPMRSLRSIYIVDGRPEMSAESMLSLVRERCPDARIQPIEITRDKIVLRVFRPPQMEEPFLHVVEAASFQHLFSRNNWKMYREDMLWARAISRMCRRFFSDITAGAYAVGEISEGEAPPQTQPTTKITQLDREEVVIPEDDDGDDPGSEPDGVSIDESEEWRHG